MDTEMITTPFGRRPMTIGQLAEQKRVRAMPDGISVDKWKVFHTIRTIRKPLGATDRALSVLNALLSFHPQTLLSSADSLIVWPSNEQLCTRANGMSETTLRRHLAVLVGCGLIIRRDSPNGKRYARKTHGGAVAKAYGFDLSPLVVRAAEFKALAAKLEAERGALRSLREQLTLLRRDVAKLIELGLAEHPEGDWNSHIVAYRSIIDTLPRSPCFETIAGAITLLMDLRQTVEDVLETFIVSTNPTANAQQNDRHIQNSETEDQFESEMPGNGNLPQPEQAETPKPDRDQPSRLQTISLEAALQACPDISQYEKGGHIRHWADFIRAAETARTVLDISGSAWTDARAAMGPIPAAITLAAILQHAERISCPGGYLRSLTEKARTGKFTTQPMIQALRNRQRLHSETTSRKGRGGHDASDGLVVSEALCRLVQH